MGITLTPVLINKLKKAVYQLRFDLLVEEYNRNNNFQNPPPSESVKMQIESRAIRERNQVRTIELDEETNSKLENYFDEWNKQHPEEEW